MTDGDHWRRLAWAIVLTLLLAVWPLPSDANHGRPYSARVTEARQWARDRLSHRQWRCFDRLIHAESGWSIHARTPPDASPARAAYGLGQAYPGRRMNAAERPWRGRGWDDYRHDWRVQLTWVFHYIRGRYGTMCHARRSQVRNGWY